MPMLIGESFVINTGVGVAAATPAMQIEGDAPNRYFLATVVNRGPGILVLSAEQSAGGFLGWTTCAASAAGVAAALTLVASAEGSFNFIVTAPNMWWRFFTTNTGGRCAADIKLTATARQPTNV